MNEKYYNSNAVPTEQLFFVVVFCLFFPPVFNRATAVL